VRNTTLPLIKYGIQYIRTHLKFIWSAPNYFIIHPLGGRLTSYKMAANGQATFHVSGKVNKQNVRIWGTEKPHRIVENERDSPKTNVFCAISMSKVYGPYFFPDRTVNGETFRNMLTTWLMPQLEHDSADFVYQLDGAPCHYHRNVRNFLNETLPHRWIGRAVNNDHHLLLWPPRSPDLTPCDFFLWGYVKDSAYKPPLPQNV